MARLMTRCRTLLATAPAVLRSLDAQLRDQFGRRCRDAADAAMRESLDEIGTTWTDLAIELNQVATELGYPIDGIEEVG